MKKALFLKLVAGVLLYRVNFVRASAAVSLEDHNSSPEIALDNVGLVIVLVLVSGVTIAILLAALDRLYSLCSQVLRLTETSLQQRSGPQTTVVVSDSTRTATMPPPESGNATDSAREQTRATEGPLDLKPPCVPPKTRSFRIELATGLLPKIHCYITKFLQEHGADNETGGLFVGDYLLAETTNEATFRIRGFIDAGPNADFSAGSIQFDHEYQSKQLQCLQLENRTVAQLGCTHLQPGFMDACSMGDLVTDREATMASDTKALVFAIITLNNPRQLLSSVRHDDFKFDFYLMAEETGYNYQAVLPSLVDLPVLEVSPSLAALRSLRGPQLTFDFALLKQLPGVTNVSVQSTNASGVVVNTYFSKDESPLRLWVKPTGALHVIHENDDGMRELSGPWTQPELGAHVWMSHLILQARHLLSPTPAAAFQRHYGLIDDKQRLVLEVRAMEATFGSRAVLRREGNSLCWHYTVRQSGREFPIKVIYPEKYPAEPPGVVSVLPLPSSPHQLSGNRPCWIDVYSSHAEWNPARDTAVIAINAATRWFACLLIYLTTREWPEVADDWNR